MDTFAEAGTSRSSSMTATVVRVLFATLLHERASVPACSEVKGSNCIAARFAPGALASGLCLTTDADLAETTAVHFYDLETPAPEYDAIANVWHSSQ